MFISILEPKQKYLAILMNVLYYLLKKMTLLDNSLSKTTRNNLIFTDFGVYFFWSYLICLAFLAIYVLIYDKKVITN